MNHSWNITVERDQIYYKTLASGFIGLDHPVRIYLTILKELFLIP